MVNDKKGGNLDLRLFYPCPDASLFLASINQEEYGQCQDLKRKAGKPGLGARNKQ